MVRRESTETYEDLDSLLAAAFEHQPTWRLVEEEAGNDAEEHPDTRGEPSGLVLQAGRWDVLLEAQHTEVGHHEGAVQDNGIPGCDEAANLLGRNLDKGDRADAGDRTDAYAGDDSSCIQSSKIRGEGGDELANDPNRSVQSVRPEAAEAVVQKVRASSADSVANVDDGDKVADLFGISAGVQAELLLERG